jgi:hypothetical protein
MTTYVKNIIALEEYSKVYGLIQLGIQYESAEIWHESVKVSVDKIIPYQKDTFLIFLTESDDKQKYGCATFIINHLDNGIYEIRGLSPCKYNICRFIEPFPVINMNQQIVDILVAYTKFIADNFRIKMVNPEQYVKNYIDDSEKTIEMSEETIKTIISKQKPIVQAKPYDSQTWLINAKAQEIAGDATTKAIIVEPSVVTKVNLSEKSDRKLQHRLDRLYDKKQKLKAKLDDEVEEDMIDICNKVELLNDDILLIEDILAKRGTLFDKKEVKVTKKEEVKVTQKEYDEWFQTGRNGKKVPELRQILMDRKIPGVTNKTLKKDMAVLAKKHIK